MICRIASTLRKSHCHHPSSRGLQGLAWARRKISSLMEREEQKAAVDSRCESQVLRERPIGHRNGQAEIQPL